METVEEFDKEYDIKLKKLKENCKHQKVREYHDRCSATGEWIDFYIKKCDICETVLSRKTWCADCHKEIHDNEIMTMEIWGFELCFDCYKNKDTFWVRLSARNTLGK